MDEERNPVKVARQMAEARIPEAERDEGWAERWDALEAYCEQPVLVPRIFTASGKCVMLNRTVFADACSEEAAQEILAALLERPYSSSLQRVEEKLEAVAALLVPEEEPVALDDLACPKCSNYRMEETGLADNYQCKACQYQCSMDHLLAANSKT